MPTEKDRKRRVRARMRKTGESYTTARAQLERKRKPPRPGAKSSEEYAELAGTADEAVRERTGKTWKQWVRTLDALDAFEWSHRDIARHLHTELGVPHWWAQTVTVGYERIRGLRAKGQQRNGSYEISKSKTVPVPVAALYRAFEARARKRWLGDVAPRVRKATPGKTIRFDWPDGTKVDAYFLAKGAAKSQVAIQHRLLASKADAERARAEWTERLGELGRMLAGKG